MVVFFVGSPRDQPRLPPNVYEMKAIYSNKLASGGLLSAGVVVALVIMGAGVLSFFAMTCASGTLSLRRPKYFSRLVAQERERKLEFTPVHTTESEDMDEVS